MQVTDHEIDLCHTISSERNNGASVGMLDECLQFTCNVSLPGAISYCDDLGYRRSKNSNAIVFPHGSPEIFIHRGSKVTMNIKTSFKPQNPKMTTIKQFVPGQKMTLKVPHTVTKSPFGAKTQISVSECFNL